MRLLDGDTIAYQSGDWYVMMREDGSAHIMHGCPDPEDDLGWSIYLTPPIACSRCEAPVPEDVWERRDSINRPLCIEYMVEG